jgi:hypothetical protein
MSGLNVGLVAERQLPVAAAIELDDTQVEDRRVQQRTAERRAVDKPGAVGQPGKPFEQRPAHDLLTFPGIDTAHVDKAVEPDPARALKCNRAVVGRPAHDRVVSLWQQRDALDARSVPGRDDERELRFRRLQHGDAPTVVADIAGIVALMICRGHPPSAPISQSTPSSESLAGGVK